VERELNFFIVDKYTISLERTSSHNMAVGQDIAFVCIYDEACSFAAAGVIGVK
jgi:hypothetical protein